MHNRRRFIQNLAHFSLLAWSGALTRLAAGRGRNGPSESPPPLERANIEALAGQAGSFDIFLLMGQSNMKGRGIIPPHQPIDRRIVMLHMKNDQWYFARDPLHLVGQPDTFDGSDNAGVGPGLSFAHTVLARQPTHLIGLIPCAVGGSTISPWKGPGARFYDNAIRRARLAIATAPGPARVRAVLWMQGESDGTEQRYPAYEANLRAMIAHLRKDLDDAHLPFISATVRELSGNNKLAQRFPHCQEINLSLLKVADDSPWNTCVDLRDLTESIGDGVHYDTATQTEIGRRLAKSYFALADLAQAGTAAP